mmetsp:Transcript_25521/g.78654  ORF Transcript_25521/g.78654 Transcript_25521/m.78654 type:complete len:92 (+) Transcript_25521:780-1055(+)
MLRTRSDHAPAPELFQIPIKPLPPPRPSALSEAVVRRLRDGRWLDAMRWLRTAAGGEEQKTKSCGVWTARRGADMVDQEETPHVKPNCCVK